MTETDQEEQLDLPPRGLEGPVAVIRLDRVAENWRRLDRASGPQTETAAAVKANAYGVGLARVAPTLLNEGCRHFFVAHAREALGLREILGADPEIYVLNGPRTGLPLIREAGAVPVLSAPEDIAIAAGASEGGRCVLQFETGMNRLGLPAEIIPELPQLLGSALKPVMFMSHLASADMPESPQPEEQRARWETMVPRLRELNPEARVSLAATGGILRGSAFHYDMSRPGIGLYGAAPFDMAGAAAVALFAPVLRAWTVEAGESSGYGETWTAPRQRRLATVGIGYADGYPRALSNRGKAVVFATPSGDGGTSNAALERYTVPVVGRVSMDLLTIDITDAPPVFPGATVQLIGAPEVTLDAVAATAGTIGYELLTGLGGRIERRYTSAH